MDGNVAQGSINVPPYSSKVFYMQDASICDLATEVAAVENGTESTLLYPNPVNAGDLLHLAGSPAGTFIITDLQGAVVVNTTLTAGSATVAIPSGLAPGLYVARISGNGQDHVQKLVVR